MMFPPDTFNHQKYINLLRNNLLFSEKIMFCANRNIFILAEKILCQVMDILIELIASNSYLRFLSIFLISVILALVVNYLMRTYATKVAAKTKSAVDDEILKAIMFPVFISIVFWGFYAASASFESLQGYFRSINRWFFIFYTVMFCVFFSRVIEILVNNWLKVRRGIDKTPRLLRNILVALLGCCACRAQALQHFHNAFFNNARHKRNCARACASEHFRQFFCRHSPHLRQADKSGRLH
jgi:hypothetical protein